MADALVRETEKLYGLDPTEFTAARNARAKALKKDDPELAAAVAALPKPSVAAAALNELLREDPSEVRALIQSGKRLRQAQEAAVSGKKGADLNDGDPGAPHRARPRPARPAPAQAERPDAREGDQDVARHVGRSRAAAAARARDPARGSRRVRVRARPRPRAGASQGCAHAEAGREAEASDYYPQGGEFSDDVSNAMQLRRNRSTRSLWDPAYVDETWINDRVQLVRRLRTWVNTSYPGTATGITEYNWGAENHINGATTQADIYGIFGREGLDMAARWTTPASSTPTYKAMKMYRNYDGNRSTFGETSIAATTQNPDTVSAFAGQRSADGALTIMVVSKGLSATTAATVSVANFQHAGTVQVWQLTAANSITHLPDVSLGGTNFGVTLPAQSVTLLIVPAGSAAPGAPTSLRITN